MKSGLLVSITSERLSITRRHGAPCSCIFPFHYARSGVLVLGNRDASEYSNAAFENDRQIGADVTSFASPDAIRAFLASRQVSTPPLASFEKNVGYHNADGGWAASARGVDQLLGEVRARGVVIVPGFAVSELIRDGEEDVVRGVRAHDGREIHADHVVLASGSWTPSTFAGQLGPLSFEQRCLATG
jgi:sarcosine oxidase / L-pipecolate oxidase